MSFHVPNTYRIREGLFATTEADGNNGAFNFKIWSKNIAAVASDGMGWEHVSVSMVHETPCWNIMCKIKDLFWDEEDCVIQYHPPKSEYVNAHHHCLLLWRPIGIVFPRPDPIMVGPR